MIAGTDCGFSQSPLGVRVHYTIMWAKQRMLAEGAAGEPGIVGEARGGLKIKTVIGLGSFVSRSVLLPIRSYCKLPWN